MSDHEPDPRTDATDATDEELVVEAMPVFGPDSPEPAGALPLQDPEGPDDEPSTGEDAAPDADGDSGVASSDGSTPTGTASAEAEPAGSTPAESTPSPATPARTTPAPTTPADEGGAPEVDAPEAAAPTEAASPTETAAPAETPSPAETGSPADSAAPGKPTQTPAPDEAVPPATASATEGPAPEATPDVATTTAPAVTAETVASPTPPSSSTAAPAATPVTPASPTSPSSSTAVTQEDEAAARMWASVRDRGPARGTSAREETHSGSAQPAPASAPGASAAAATEDGGGAGGASASGATTAGAVGETATDGTTGTSGTATDGTAATTATDGTTATTATDGTTASDWTTASDTDTTHTPGHRIPEIPSLLRPATLGSTAGLPPAAAAGAAGAAAATAAHAAADSHRSATASPTTASAVGRADVPSPTPRDVLENRRHAGTPAAPAPAPVHVPAEHAPLDAWTPRTPAAPHAGGTSVAPPTEESALSAEDTGTPTSPALASPDTAPATTGPTTTTHATAATPAATAPAAPTPFSSTPFSPTPFSPAGGDAEEPLDQTSVRRRSLVTPTRSQSATQETAWRPRESDLVAGRPTSTPATLDDALFEGSTVVPVVPSRTAAHVWGVIAFVVLLPLTWYAGEDAGARMTLATDAPMLTGTLNFAALLELLAAALGAIVLALVTLRSSLGAQVLGALVAVVGIPWVIAPGWWARTILPALDGLTSWSDLGANIAHHLQASGYSGRLLLLGVLVWLAGLISHSVRRRGRAEEAVRAEVERVNPAGAHLTVSARRRAARAQRESGR